MIREEGEVGVRDCKVANYPHEVSACEGQKLGRAKPPSCTALVTKYSGRVSVKGVACETIFLLQL